MNQHIHPHKLNHTKQSQGFDNVLALRHLAQDRFRMSLNKYIPDRQDRKRVVKVSRSV